MAVIERRIEETKSAKPSLDQFWAGQISASKDVRTIYNSKEEAEKTGKECSGYITTSKIEWEE